MVQGVARDVNGPLLYALAKISDHIDPECIEFFRNGAPLYGLLARSGIGAQVDCPFVPEVEDAMLAHCPHRNTQLLASLREDTFAAVPTSHVVLTKFPQNVLALVSSTGCVFNSQVGQYKLSFAVVLDLFFGALADCIAQCLWVHL